MRKVANLTLNEQIFDLFEAKETNVVRLAASVGVDPSIELRSANLEGADLSDENLSGFDLSGARLSGANLTGSNVFMADFRSADVSAATFAGAVMPECAILPPNCEPVASGKVAHPEMQRIVKRARAIHDNYLNPRSMHDGPIMIDGTEDVDAIYSSAVVLDTIGSQIPGSLYNYIVYLLSRPFQNDPSDMTSDIQSIQKRSSSTNSPGSEDIDPWILWLLQNQVDGPKLYGAEEVNGEFELLPPLFWREKLAFRYVAIGRAICVGEFDRALSLIARSRLTLKGRTAPWQEARLDIAAAVVSLIVESRTDKLVRAMQRATCSLPEKQAAELNRFVVWELYVPSVHLNSPSLADFTANFLSKCENDFFRGNIKIEDRVEQVLGSFPGYWRMTPRRAPKNYKPTRARKKSM